MPLLSQGGCIKDLFVTEEEVIDRFTGQELWLWGCGDFGRLGNNSVAIQSSPVQTISGGNNWKQVALGLGSTASIKTDGTLWGWGLCSTLGTNSNINRSSPVQTISGGTNWRSVSLGNSHAAAIKTDGTLWLWGNNANGQIGDNTATNKSSPVQTISGGTNWRQVSLIGNNSAAIKTDGTLWLWGSGVSGRIGNNSIGNQFSPVQTISGGTNWRQVSSGGAHSAAIKTDGTLWLWGSGIFGQLGNNSIGNQSSPVQTISGGTNWRSVSSGDLHSAAIKTDGTLWLWGCGGQAALGNNSIVNQSSPVQTISGGTNWRQVSLGAEHSAAIKTDGTLWLWGRGFSGQLGTNSITAHSSPVQTISGGTNWRSVSLGSSFTAATCVTEY